jgi:hypothetical protein
MSAAHPAGASYAVYVVGDENEVIAMRRVLQMFQRLSRARQVAAGILGVGLLAVCMYTALHGAGGATAATPSPRIGDSFAVFQAAYGQPAKTDTDRGPAVGHVTLSGERFYADKARTIIVEVQPIQGVVKNLFVSGPASWTDKQTVAFCQRYLPSSATAFRATGPYTYYHSSAGDVVIFDAGSNACEVGIQSNNE